MRSSQFMCSDSAQLVGWAGDWHGDGQWAQHAVATLANHGARVIYHVGDFGLWGGNDGLAYLRKVQKALVAHDLLCVVTPGNHENYDLLEKFPINLDGFQVCPDASRIWFAPRGHVWLHGSAKVASLGGAGSIDMSNRQPGLSWWPQEAITRDDVTALARNLEIQGFSSVDVMMTHDVPAGVILEPKSGVRSPEIENYCYQQRVLLREAADFAAPATLVHGHWHRYHHLTLDGVSMSGVDYRSEVIGLDKEYTQRNLMTGSLVAGEGIVGHTMVWK